MNIFASLQVYAGKWNLAESRNFSEEEVKMVEKAFVVPSQYGNSLCMMMVAGGKTFLPMSNDSSVSVGQEVDLKKAQLLRLTKSGENDIFRVKA